VVNFPIALKNIWNNRKLPVIAYLARRSLQVIAKRRLGKTMKNTSTTGRSKRGRPRTAANLARPHRIVTFVTDMEKEHLEQVTLDEERSMACVVHRIIKTHFEEK
jgi:hypothetical protein